MGIKVSEYSNHQWYVHINNAKNVQLQNVKNQGTYERKMECKCGRTC
jgi:hypothetical protein